MSSTPTDNEPVSIVYCHAREDEKHRRKLEAHLAIMKMTGRITDWQETKSIQAGANVDDAIERAFNNADLMLLLVSPDLINSGELYKQQIEPALVRREQKKIHIIPVLVRETYEWQELFRENIQQTPRNRPVELWDNKDEAWVSVVRAVDSVVKDIQKRKNAEKLQQPPSQHPSEPSPLPATMQTSLKEFDIINALVRLLDDIEDIKSTAYLAGLNPAQIRTNPKAFYYWLHVWHEAGLQQKRLAIIEIILAQYPHDQTLQNIQDQLKRGMI